MLSCCPACLYTYSLRTRLKRVQAHRSSDLETAPAVGHGPPTLISSSWVDRLPNSSHAILRSPVDHTCRPAARPLSSRDVLHMHRLTYQRRNKGTSHVQIDIIAVHLRCRLPWKIVLCLDLLRSGTSPTNANGEMRHICGISSVNCERR